MLHTGGVHVCMSHIGYFLDASRREGCAPALYQQKG